jgi:hypothetical protein
MIAGTIWTQLVKTLEGTPDLKYIKYVYQGRRFDFEPNALPLIMLEPANDGEPDRRYESTDDQFFEVSLYAFSSNDFNSFKNPIIGDATHKGILRIVNDIRAVLKGSYDLGGTVIDTRLQPAFYDTLEENYPVRGAVMNLRFLYRQNYGA